MKINNTSNDTTKGIKTLLGDPKKAIRILAVPMIIAMFIQTFYNVVDTWWVSGLGTNALAAVGFVFPFFVILMSFATGIGVGGGTAISRKIGAKDKKSVDNIAIHTLIVMLLMTIIFSIILFCFAYIIFEISGAGKTIDMAVGYGQIIFGGSIFIFFINVANALLRAEGDSKRPMYAMIFGAIVNVILDPIFIYKNLNINGIKISGLDYGVSGAAWATILSLALTSIIMLYWLFIKKDTYISIKFRGFKFNKTILKDIFKVGIPATLLQLSMAITMIIINIIIINIVNVGTDGVAVYQTGWKIASIAIMPIIGISTAVMAVIGTTYGAKDFLKLNTAYIYSIKLSFLIEIIIAFATFILAPFIATSFTTAQDSAKIFNDLQIFLMIICLFYPGVAFGMISSSMFQGVGEGFNSLIITLLRTVIFTPIFVIIFSNVFMFGLQGVWWGIVTANLIGSTIAFIWGKIYIKNLFKKINENKRCD